MRIVVAVRPGGSPEQIAEAVCGLPLPEPVEAVLVSALDLPRPPLTSFGPTARSRYAAALQCMRTDARRVAAETTEGLRCRLAPRLASVTVRIPDARAAAAVVQTAAGWRADLILIGPGPGPGPVRLLLGSVTAEVVRWAPCPVLVDGPGCPRLRRVLAATDGSLHAEAALRFLAGLPIPAASRVRICAVAESPPGDWWTRLRGLGRRASPPWTSCNRGRRSAASPGPERSWAASPARPRNRSGPAIPGVRWRTRSPSGPPTCCCSGRGEEQRARTPPSAA